MASDNEIKSDNTLEKVAFASLLGAEASTSAAVASGLAGVGMAVAAPIVAGGAVAGLILAAACGFFDHEEDEAEQKRRASLGWWDWLTENSDGSGCAT